MRSVMRRALARSNGPILDGLNHVRVSPAYCFPPSEKASPLACPAYLKIERLTNAGYAAHGKFP
jgi:hypothetical protein